MPKINSAAPRPRGRPASIDRARVCVVALRLFERKGFDVVTMDEVAVAAKVARRTLFRQFPSKADLVWDELRGVMERLTDRAGEAGARRLTLPELIDVLVRPTLRWLEQPKVARLAQRRLRLIKANPVLLSHPLLGELERAFAVQVARAPALPGPPALITASLFAVGMGSILWWAEAGHRSGVTALEAFERAASSLASSVAR